MNLDLKNKRALVCGSTQGIGKASAIEIALLGANVTLVARNEDALKKTLDELDTTKNQTHNFLCVDFRRHEEVQKKAEEYVKENTVHILVNNTGGPAGGSIISAKTEDFTNTFANHLLCNHVLVQAVVDGMKKEKYGRIINIISTSVKIPIKGLGVSNTIRAAVANWAKTLSLELAPFGITVNNVLPGMTNTLRLTDLMKAKAKASGKTFDEIQREMIAEIPMTRFAEANEVANAVAFLATPAAAYINGINVPVDGGRTGSL